MVVAVLGAGSWGTALAIHLARNGHVVHLWGHRAEHINNLKQHRSNERYLPGLKFPDNLHPITSLNQAIDNVEHILVVVPSHVFADLLSQLKSITSCCTSIIWATKGFEHKSGRLLHQVMDDMFANKKTYAILSGPTFATEVARGMPTAVTIAAPQMEFAQKMGDLFHSSKLRVYTTDDLIGVEVGGAVKNVLAIAAGIIDGLGFGANTRAALITRGLAEMTRLGIRLGGKQETFMGLSCLGDLVLTCTDNQSRNRRFGLAIGEGKPLQEARLKIGQVVEGEKTAFEVRRVAHRMQIEMPITEQVCRVLKGESDVRQAVEMLLAREQKKEKL